MLIEKIGEFGLIDRLKNGTINAPDTVIEGIGDDAAVLRPTADMWQLFCTDMLVEDIHFITSAIKPWQLGWRAVAVNISDIAAMGGLPRHLVISLALPRNIEVGFVEGVYDGMKHICREFAINIVGGDTVSSRNGLAINVALLGEVEPAMLCRRAGARDGDLVVVTNTLGASAAGLALLQAEATAESFAPDLLAAHFTPQPQIAAGRAAAAAGATAMDDISDGLASESNEIAAASDIGLRIYADKLPLSREMQLAAEFLHTDSISYALYGGEDFQLIFTIAESDYERLISTGCDAASFTVVGEAVAGIQGVRLVAGGQEINLAPKGYNHFR